MIGTLTRSLLVADEERLPPGAPVTEGWDGALTAFPQLSEHLLAEVIVLAAREGGWGLLPADEFSAGLGVAARVANRFVRVGFS